ncbi:MAG: serine hydrolase domain-containing protein [Candidatus Cryptobacteroides sp.]
MKRFLVVLLLAAGLVAGAKNGVKESGTHYAEEALRPYVESGVLPGAICVFYNDGIQETCCIGYADVQARRPIRMDNVFMQCSQTKGFCGVTMAKLIEEGKVGLDDPVSKYLPEFSTLWVLDSANDSTKVLKRAKNVLTIRMLLNHTGGFPFECSAKRNDVRGGGWTGGGPLRQIAAVAAESPLRFEPGTKVLYSNTGIDIAAAVIETVTGMKWEDYLKQTVLEPLGMKSTGFWPTDKQLKTQIQLYQTFDDSPAMWLLENPWGQRPYNDSHVFASAGAGLWTTANDQLKFYKMLMNLGVGDNGVRILKEETVKNILAKSTRQEGLEPYSLGLFVSGQDSEDSWFGHGGAFGTSCSVNWHKKQLVLFVVQISDGRYPWNPALVEAQNAFFRQTTLSTGVEAYTGRTE